MATGGGFDRFKCMHCIAVGFLVNTCNILLYISMIHCFGSLITNSLDMIFLFVVYRFIAIEQLRFKAEESLQVLISSQQVYFLGRDPSSQNVVLQTTYDKLYHCRSVMSGE